MREFFVFLMRSLSPQQVCWVCLLATMGAGFYGARTFASNVAVGSLTDDVHAIKVVMLEDRAFTLRAQQCHSLASGQISSAYREELQEVLRKYREITGGPYQLPPCSEL